MGVTVRNPVSEEPVVPYKVVSGTQYEHEQAIHGFYSVCLDNESAFDTKASLYLLPNPAILGGLLVGAFFQFNIKFF